MPTASKVSKAPALSAAALALGLFAGPAAAQDLLTNRSFEDPIAPAAGNNIGLAPTGWQIDRGLFNLVRDPAALDGAQFVDLTQEPGGLPGTYIFQDFTLTEAAPIRFSGFFSPRDNATGGGNVAIYTTDGTELAAAPRVQAQGTNSPWVESFATTGELAPGTYQFRAFIDDPANVDLVSVLVVPEPASLSLLALGGLAVLPRRRRRA